MPSLHEQIAEKFLTRLSESDSVDVNKVEQLRALLAKTVKPKSDDFIKVFSLPAGGDLK